jgi:hypothetical protein
MSTVLSLRSDISLIDLSTKVMGGQVTTCLHCDQSGRTLLPLRNYQPVMPRFVAVPTVVFEAIHPLL